MKSPAPLLSAALALLLLATAIASADPFHERGELAAAVSRLFWTEVDEKEIPQFYSEQSESSPLSRFPALLNTPANAWAEHWVRAIDEAARKKSPERFRHIPRPRVFMTAHRDVNGSVRHINRCAKLDVKVRKPYEKPTTLASGRRVFGLETLAPGETEIKPRALLLVSRSHRYVSVADVEESCDTPVAPEELVAHFNSFNPKCQIRRDGSQWVLEGDACPFFVLTNDETIRQIQFPAQANWIQLQAGAIHQLGRRFGDARGERAAVALLAHELAHLYRAHGVRGPDYGFFYELKQFADQAKLKAVRGDEALAETAAGLDSSVLHRKLVDPAKRFHPAIAAWIADRFRDSLDGFTSCEDSAGGCAPSCHEWTRFTTSWGSGLLSEQAPEEIQGALDTMIKCMQSIPLKPTQSGPVSAKELRQALEEDFDVDLDGIREASTAHDLLVAANGRFVPYERRQAQFMAKLEAQGLGSFTTEEEADGLALELLSLVGLAPESLLDVYLEWIKAEEAKVSPAKFLEDHAMNAAQCAQLADPQMLPLSAAMPRWLHPGSLNDDRGAPRNHAHHSPCYRAFQLRRELAVHRYPPAQAPAAATALWKAAATWAETDRTVTVKPAPGDPAFNIQLNVDARP